jgi:hypothetical protein
LHRQLSDVVHPGGIDELPSLGGSDTWKQRCHGIDKFSDRSGVTPKLRVDRSHARGDCHTIELGRIPKER